MKTRISRTIVGVTALVLVVLGVPFAIVVQRFYDSRATVELQRSAAQAIVELSLPLRADEIAAAAREPDAPADFSVYDANGLRLYGSGPDRVDTAQPDRLVVVSEVTDRETETVVGSVLVSRPRAEVDAAARRAWFLMALAAAGGLALAILVARRESARLSAPISDLAERAGRLGEGDFDITVPRSGVAELDTLGAALTLSSRRLAETMAREREFSANVSHQLRTPLAGLRMSLERGDVHTATAEAERLAETVDHLLAMARDTLPAAEAIDIAPIVHQAGRRWEPRFRDDGRELIVEVRRRLPPVRARPGSIEQVLDIVLDNAARHGAGTVRLTARPAAGGLVVAIDDEGPGIAADRAEVVFDRHEGTGTGIGLTLARTLAEAEGGRLILADPDVAGFQLVFTTARAPLRPETTAAPDEQAAR